MIRAGGALGLLVAMCLQVAPAAAQDQAADTGTPPSEVTQSGDVGSATRISTLVVYGSDPCPRSSNDEIVVCARQPESERYRIPRKLRPQPYNAARDGSWAGTAKVLENVNQQGIPNSCNPIGSFGQSGCFQKFLEENGRLRTSAAP